jgi:putative membrane protein
MYVKRNYGFWMTFNWSKKPFLLGLLYAGAITVVHYLLRIDLSLPFQPVSIIGIAVAFYLGFKNNSSYDRTWEARKIWGGIVNNSRSFGAAVVAFVQGEDAANVRKELIYRHVAWITALRYQLRLSREWEHTEARVKGLYNPNICEEYYDSLDQELVDLIPEAEFQVYKTKANIATQILARQSQRLQQLRNNDYFEDFRHMELQAFITSFYEDQGKSERIKNFPFPRQYASVALWLSVVFSAILPFGLLETFSKMEGWVSWLVVPFSALIIWVFFLMEKIGDYSENPFEGTYNDIPITSIAVNIEIDLREMIDDKDIPEPMKAVNGFLM